ncbi:MAG: hypothetical protein VKL60_15230 [Sphaerospermopsis sp.]|nr:hypothetical protein [Sphaerospermopsis sp.]
MMNDEDNLETVVAKWKVELQAECPRCEKDIDLLDDPDYWLMGVGGEVRAEDAEESYCGYEFIIEVVNA